MQSQTFLFRYCSSGDLIDFDGIRVCYILRFYSNCYGLDERLQGKLDDIGASEISYPRQSSNDPKPPHPIADYVQRVAQTFSYKYGYLVKDVKFDDAPEIVYGITFRVRRFYDCNEEGQDCGKLETEGKVVQCDVSRFR